MTAAERTLLRVLQRMGAANSYPIYYPWTACTVVNCTRHPASRMMRASMKNHRPERHKPEWPQFVDRRCDELPHWCEIVVPAEGADEVQVSFRAIPPQAVKCSKIEVALYQKD